MGTPLKEWWKGLKHIAILEDLNFTNIVISLKASDVRLTIDAYKLIKSGLSLSFGDYRSWTIWTGTQSLPLV